MTRINVVPPYSLADQHLLAEYRELPRMRSYIDKLNENGGVRLEKLLTAYVLGKGHMLFFAPMKEWLEERHSLLIIELQHRGINLSYKEKLVIPRLLILDNEGKEYSGQDYDVKPFLSSIYRHQSIARGESLNILRLKEKFKARPTFYKWTGRTPPMYYYRALKELTES